MYYSSVNEIAPCIKLYDDVWPSSEEFIKKIEDGTHTSDVRWGAGTLNSSKGPMVDTKYRDVKLISIPSFEGFEPTEESHESVHKMFGLYNEIIPNIHPIIQEYSNDYTIATTTKTAIQILRYDKDQFFSPHVDDSPNRPRRISYVYYINDDYEGGEIEFTWFNIKVKPKAKQLLVFPSNYAYRHTVYPVISGTRYAMVQWWN